MTFIDDVLVVGDKPGWYTGKHIPDPQLGMKLECVQRRLLLACEEVGEEFLLMNDDFFVPTQMTEKVVYHGMPLDQYRPVEPIVATAALTGWRFPSFDLHCPMPVRTAIFSDALKLCQRTPGERPLHRTVYGWLADLPDNEDLDYSEDFYVGHRNGVGKYFSKPWFSTGPRAGHGWEFDVAMRRHFPNKSRWES